MTKYAMAINLHRCVGCRTCTVSCKMENGVADGIARMRVLNDQGETTLDVPSGTYPELAFLWRPTSCQQCDDPACIAVCPTGATFKREEDGVVVIDKEVCIGCSSCVEACPYHARAIDEAAGKADKCEMCLHRLANGVETTMCQMCCPNRAIVVGDLDDPESEIAKIVAEKQTERFMESEGTNPNVYYWDSMAQ